VVSCFKINFDGSRPVEIAAMCGFDCVWVDREHTATEWGDIEKQVLATKTQDVDLVVRVNRGGYSEYVKPLELDASGIIVPHIMSLADAQQVVRMTRFQPVGRRAVDGGNADGGYCLIDFNEYLRQANDQRFVIVQIEDPEPLDELEKIAALDGIDMIFFGPGDFSHSIGAPGQWDHPLIGETRRRIARVCLDHGKYAATVGSLANLDELVDMGYRFISVGADVVGMSNYCSGIVDGFQASAGRVSGAAAAGSGSVYR
jgi:4-hydroxy-2-oxoheptanedioate aldolase